MKFLGSIIAGGKSSRMGGGEKGLLSLGGISVIERVRSRIQFQVDEVIINANGPPERFAAIGCTVVPDLLTGVGTPLAGLHASLDYARSHGFAAVLTVPSDTPFLPLDLVRRLEAEGRATGAAVAMSNGQTHFLTGLWSSALAPVLESAIRKDGLVRVQDFVSLLKTQYVEWMSVPHDPFFNINTPEDMTLAASYLHE